MLTFFILIWIVIGVMIGTDAAKKRGYPISTGLWYGVLLGPFCAYFYFGRPTPWKYMELMRERLTVPGLSATELVSKPWVDFCQELVYSSPNQQRWMWNQLRRRQQRELLTAWQLLGLDLDSLNSGKIGGDVAPVALRPDPDPDPEPESTKPSNSVVPSLRLVE